jgi:peptidoglycan/xylan/chitin deacetylase (PgdA/CDA1 family)
MRPLFALLLLLAGAPPALAESHTEDCAAGGGRLGVSRVAEIDTTCGPAFGEQYPGTPLLGPREVVLTFDDGPSPDHTDTILAALAAECTKATFFQVGRMASAYPDMARKVLAGGHTVGTHTWSHANLAGRSADSARPQVERAFTAILGILGGDVAPFFRFPYLGDSKPVRKYLATRDIAVFDIDVDSFDYLHRSADRVLKSVVAGLTKSGGGIILMHDIHRQTAEAVPKVLEYLRANNYKVVHLVAKSPLVPVAVSQAETAEPPRARPAPRRRNQDRNKDDSAVPGSPW